MSVSRKLIFLIIIIACLKRASANFKIVGGVLSTIVQTPFQGVYYSNDDFTCSASLISNQFALTAAHCTYYFPNNITLRFGSSYRNRDGVVASVEKFISHPNYNPRTFDYDFCILKLARPIKFTRNIQPAKLPTTDSLLAGSNCSVSGWGLESYIDIEDPPVQLLSTSVQIIDFAQCTRSYLLVAQSLTDRMFCAASVTSKGNHDACLGDSGGPIICGGKLCGVVSFGYGCGMKDFPGIYSKVSSVIPWINATIQS